MNEQQFIQLSRIVPDVSRETFDDLCRYASFIRKWQPHINLVANSTVSDLWHRHIMDSAQLYPLHKKAENWLDLGSGGGFPAIVIAIFLKGAGKGHVDLVESNGKKAAFLRTVIASLSLPARVHHIRIENYHHNTRPHVITARALASLTRLFDLIIPLLTSETIALLQKGRDCACELDEASAQWQFDLLKHRSAVVDDSFILEISNLRAASQAGKRERQAK